MFTLETHFAMLCFSDNPLPFYLTVYKYILYSFFITYQFLGESIRTLYSKIKMILNEE